MVLAIQSGLSVVYREQQHTPQFQIFNKTAKKKNRTYKDQHVKSCNGLCLLISCGVHSMSLGLRCRVLYKIYIQLACGDCLRKPLHEFPELLGVGGTDSIFITITPIIRVIITPVDIITLIILTAS